MRTVDLLDRDVAVQKFVAGSPHPCRSPRGPPARPAGNGRPGGRGLGLRDPPRCAPPRRGAEARTRTGGPAPPAITTALLRPQRGGIAPVPVGRARRDRGQRTDAQPYRGACGFRGSHSELTPAPLISHRTAPRAELGPQVKRGRALVVARTPLRHTPPYQRGRGQRYRHPHPGGRCTVPTGRRRIEHRSRPRREDQAGRCHGRGRTEEQAAQGDAEIGGGRSGRRRVAGRCVIITTVATSGDRNLAVESGDNTRGKPAAVTTRGTPRFRTALVSGKYCFPYILLRRRPSVEISCQRRRQALLTLAGLWSCVGDRHRLDDAPDRRSRRMRVFVVIDSAGRQLMERVRAQDDHFAPGS